MSKKNHFISYSLSTFSIILALLIWELYAIRVGNHYLMPYPLDVLKQFFKLFTEWHTYEVLGSTFLRLIISITISALMGLVLGLISGIHYQVESLLKPIVVTLRTLPLISIVVIILILYGNVYSLYIISFLLLFPLIYQAELDGIKNINKTLLEVLKLDCDKCSLPAIKMVFLPLSMPFFRTSLLQSAGLGIKVLVVAEFIAQTNHSIGRELYFNRINLMYSRVFAWTIILIIVVTVIEYLVNKYLKLHTDL